jgi:molecular chaperone GrpE
METEDLLPTVNQQADINTLRKRVSQLETALEDKEEKNLRLRADFDNYRKRMQKDLSSMLCREKEHMLRSFIEVYENLREAVATNSDEGLHIIWQQFKKALQEAGIEEIATVGEPFDYACHHAVASEESLNHDEGIILREIRKGYKMYDKVIKPAYVVVSKGETNGKINRN